MFPFPSSIPSNGIDPELFRFRMRVEFREHDPSCSGVHQSPNAVDARRRRAIDRVDFPRLTTLNKCVFLRMQGFAEVEALTRRPSSTGARVLRAMGQTTCHTVVACGDDVIVSVHDHAAGSTASTGCPGRSKAGQHEEILVRLRTGHVLQEPSESRNDGHSRFSV